MTLRLSLIADDGTTVDSWSRDMKRPVLDRRGDTRLYFGVQASLLVGEASDAVVATGVLDDHLKALDEGSELGVRLDAEAMLRSVTSGM